MTDSSEALLQGKYSCSCNRLRSSLIARRRALRASSCRSNSTFGALIRPDGVSVDESRDARPLARLEVEVIGDMVGKVRDRTFVTRKTAAVHNAHCCETT